MRLRIGGIRYGRGEGDEYETLWVEKKGGRRSEIRGEEGSCRCVGIRYALWINGWMDGSE